MTTHEPSLLPHSSETFTTLSLSPDRHLHSLRRTKDFTQLNTISKPYEDADDDDSSDSGWKELVEWLRLCSESYEEPWTEPNHLAKHY